MLKWALLIDTSIRKHYKDLIPENAKIFHIGKYVFCKLVDGDFPEYHLKTEGRGVKGIYTEDALLVNPGKIKDPEWLEKAKEHLKSAEILYKKGLYRDSVSRAYYAAFSALGSLTHRKFKPHGMALIKYLKSSEKLSISDEIEEIFLKLENLRKKGDYDTSFLTKEEAKNALTFSRKVFKIIS